MTFLHRKPRPNAYQTPCFHSSFFFLLLHDPLWLYYNIPCFLFASICLRTSWGEAHPQAPLASANYLLSHLHPTLNCLHAPQLGLSCSGVSHRCSCLTFRIPYFYTLGVGGLRDGGYSPARRLCEPLACLFIYRQWPIAGAELCQHFGPASCYYWPHRRMHIQTCNSLHVAQTHSPWSGYLSGCGQ